MTYTIPPPRPNQPGPTTRPEVWDYGFRRISSLFQNSTVGAGFLSVALFLLVAFSSNILLAQVSSATLGITVILSTLGLMAILILILVLI